MLRPHQRAVFGLVSALGYVPTGPTWIQRLQSLRGEFRRPGFDRTIRYAVEALGIVYTVAIVRLSLQQYARYGSVNPPLLIMAFVLAVGTAYLLLRNGVWYRLEGGILSAHRGTGALLWQEDLHGLLRVVCTRGPTHYQIRLYWPERSRRMELYPSLEVALSEPSPRHTDAKS